jgi:hypothetical protein
MSLNLTSFTYRFNDLFGNLCKVLIHFNSRVNDDPLWKLPQQHHRSGV